MAIVKEAEAGNEMGFNAQLRNSWGGKREQAGCRWTLPVGAPWGAVDSGLDLE